MSADHSPAVTTTWSIDATARSFITSITSILTAALGDDVQALAISACEAYGATLPICPETCMKVELLAQRKSTTQKMKNIGVAIGFAPGDAPYQLASNDAGVRFLALVPVLLSLGSPSKAAQCLHMLLKDASPNIQQLPTVSQLKDLFVVLGERCGCSGFHDHLAGWNMVLKSEELGLLPLFTQDLGPSAVADSLDRQRIQGFGRAVEAPESRPDIAGLRSVIDSVRSEHDAGAQVPGAHQGVVVTVEGHDTIATRPNRDSQVVSPENVTSSFSVPNLGLMDMFSSLWSGAEPAKSSSKENQQTLPLTTIPHDHPSNQSISKVLRAMSEIIQRGEASFMIIRTPPVNAVWIIAFIRWCLGFEPYIRSTKSGKLMLKQTKSQVLVEIGEPGMGDLLVQTVHGLQGVEQLLW